MATTSEQQQDQPADGPKVWERPWNSDELLKNSTSWSLAGDAGVSAAILLLLILPFFTMQRSSVFVASVESEAVLREPLVQEREPREGTRQALLRRKGEQSQARVSVRFVSEL